MNSLWLGFFQRWQLGLGPRPGKNPWESPTVFATVPVRNYSGLGRSKAFPDAMENPSEVFQGHWICKECRCFMFKWFPSKLPTSEYGTRKWASKIPHNSTILQDSSNIHLTFQSPGSAAMWAPMSAGPPNPQATAHPPQAAVQNTLRFYDRSARGHPIGGDERRCWFL